MALDVTESQQPEARPPAGDEASMAPPIEQTLADYRLAYQSRQASLLGWREVFAGKAKFGIFGDGKEVAQVAMARAFRRGDFRSGYYRDQTFMLATGTLTLDAWFAQLYAHADETAEPASAGRQMNCHFSTRLLNADGSFRDLTDLFNSSADLSPTGSQMPRMLGLAQASKMYRMLPDLADRTTMSRGGNEVVFGTIGNATCAEGMFWESINAAGVLQVPMLLSIWDDGFGISVPNVHQIAKGDLSELLAGFQRAPNGPGFEVRRVVGWDYPTLCRTYQELSEIARLEHVPVLLHVVELTQPQGHSTSGSHERYKSEERLEWEREHDCLTRMRQWMIGEGISDDVALEAIEDEERQRVQDARDRAWAAYRAPIDERRVELLALLDELASSSSARDRLETIAASVRRLPSVLHRDLLTAARDALLATREDQLPVRDKLLTWQSEQVQCGEERYGAHLYSNTPRAALNVARVEPTFGDDATSLNGFEILNRCFDSNLARHPELLAFGEDVGKLGDVNKGFDGLQAKHGALRVADTGIRECTILGQAIGMAMRGLRPIAEIQYLDYLYYALQIMSDDLSTVRWRTAGGQMAPVIVRTRGHRLEGVWHSGSLMAGIINLVRGMYVCVPRDMTRAAGFYNTLLESDDPAIVVEVLNGYRLKELLPQNIADFTVPLGMPEVLRPGKDVTVVTYGASCRIVLGVADQLAQVGIDTEVIDVQTLLPFDLDGRIGESVEKTSRVVFVDEDVPGGTTAYMLQNVLEQQGAFWTLDAEPRTVPGKPHRPAYGSDGDYFSKPNREEIFDAIYGLMNETDPRKYPAIYR